MEYKVFEIANKNGIRAKVTEFGAILMELWVPDRNGRSEDIVMGFDRPEDYDHNDSFFGATVGRSANRIADACFTIDGKTYQLAVNDGKNNLHSDYDNGFHKKHWDGVMNAEKNSVAFSYTSPDGENGFPGKLDMKVTYTVNDKNGLEIHYEGVSDKKTLVNCTNHSYFNLSGDMTSSIHDHMLKLYASHYTPVVAGAIPTGEIATVKGTVFDFTDFMKVGDHVDDDAEQLKLVKGYDHNFALDHEAGSFGLAAELTCGRSGRHMEVWTDLPGIQFYAGNCIAPVNGKKGIRYDVRQALALETQYFPNSVNQAGFISPVIDAGEKYDTKTEYRFV